MHTLRLAALLSLCTLAALASPVPASAAEGKVTVGQPLPDRRLPTVERDRTLALSQFRGKKVLLIEFASW